MENPFEVDIFKVVFTEVQKSVDLQPLQYLAAERVAIQLCETEDVQCMIKNFSKTDDKCRTVAFSPLLWKLLCNKARGKLDQIGVPNSITNIVSEHLWTVSFEISKWITYHADDIGIDGSLTFCWTPHPSIDYLKTTKMLIKSETLDVKKRFKLACLYCLESEVRCLWAVMTLSERRAFFARGNLNKSDQNPIVLYWTYYIQEVPLNYWECRTLKYAHLFKYSINNGYLSATKFFFDKLSSVTRNRWISNRFYIYLRNYQKPECIKKDFLAITCFLLCQLSSENHRAIEYDAMLCLVFRYFLEWPWQKHFMAVVKRMRIFENLEMYYTDRIYEKRQQIFGQLLEAIFEKEIMGFQDHDYKELFIEFWQGSRKKFRTFYNKVIYYEIFMKFVKKHFGFVFEEQSFPLKKKFRAILFQQNTSENETYFEHRNVEFFKFLVQEQVTTKRSIKRFNSSFLTFRPTLNTFYGLPLGELLYLIDALLGPV